MTTKDAATAPVLRVGPGDDLAPDSAFGVALVTLWHRALASATGDAIARAEVAAVATGLVAALRSGRATGFAVSARRILLGAAVLEPGRLDAAHTAAIPLLLVDAEQTGRGVGGRLLAAVLDEAESRDVRRLTVAVPDDRATVAFYTGRGFTEWGRRPGWRRYPGGLRDEVLLGTLLRSS